MTAWKGAKIMQYNGFYTNSAGNQYYWCNDCKKNRANQQCTHWDDAEDCPFEETAKAKAYREKIEEITAKKNALQLTLFPEFPETCEEWQGAF